VSTNQHFGLESLDLEDLDERQDVIKRLLTRNSRFNIFSLEVDARLMTTYPSLATFRRASEALLGLTIQARTPSYDESWLS
jgi:hypothetical protein